jgi:Saxitoxin biosynthesis operon protein SxtJ
MNETSPPNPRELRNFGLTTGGIVAVLFGLLLPWLLSRAFPLWPWIVAGLLGGLGLLIPAALGPVYRVWMKFGHVMGAINTRLILGLFFYVIITPFGFVMRLFRWDPMRRRPAEGASYRVTSRAKSPQHMEKPF